MARLRTHPGEVLREEYLVPLGLSARALAVDTAFPRPEEFPSDSGACEVACPPLGPRPCAMAVTRFAWKRGAVRTC